MKLLKRSQNPLTSAFIHALGGVLLFISGFTQAEPSMRAGGIIIGIVLMLMAIRQSVLAWEKLAGSNGA